MIQIDLTSMDSRRKCNGCGACANICPKQCISMSEDKEGFLYPLVDSKICIECGLCESICPVKKQDKLSGSLLDWREESMPDTYAVINKKEEIRMKSSSGGMFTLLAEYVLEEEGYVFGAVMSEDCKSVYHVGIHRIEELEKIRGSKYLQSTIGEVYKQAKKLLSENKSVLFSGTPCQIEGLRSYLGKEYEKLVCVDLICHGCPSPKAWRNYVEFRLRHEEKTSVRQTLFRHKLYGWKAFAVLFEYSNNTAYVGKLNEDLYMKAFLNDSILRPSCHDCRFKKLNRNSDITLADFWGVQEVLPEMDDDKGTSLVILHSDKGKKIFEELYPKMQCQKVDASEAIKYNPAMIRSAKANKKRVAFFENLERMEFDEVVKKFAKPKINRKQDLIRILKKIGIYDGVRIFYEKLKIRKN